MTKSELIEEYSIRIQDEKTFMTILQSRISSTNARIVNTRLRCGIRKHKEHIINFNVFIRQLKELN